MNRQAELYCRDILRDARATAFRDSEAFAEVLFAVERLGSLQTGKHGTLRDYKEALVALARRSPLAEDLPARRSDLHTSFPRLYSLVQTARNDALHQGASARHLTDHCVELALVLEDALVSESTTVADYMVKAPTCAFPWQPLSFVRQQMLVNSFSFLPIRSADGNWRLLSDLMVARVLRAAGTGEERNRRLATTVEEAERLFALRLELARTVTPGVLVNEVLEGPDASPVLVISESGELLGIVTSFDLL
jgi:CBS domain-containing protein